MDNVKNIKHIIVVLSGKGGVGKSTVAVQLALGLRQLDFKIGLLDIDLCGPSVPTMLNIENQSVFQSENGWIPIKTDGDYSISVMSIGFFLSNRNDAVIWRGPKKNSMIQQFVTGVAWDEDLDYLIVDTPPGTSDEHITFMQCLLKYNPDGAVLVTTPQIVAVNDVRRQVDFCRKTNLPIIGIVENMSGFICPHCSECSNVFSKGGGESLAEYINTTFLGAIPLCPSLGKSLEGQKDCSELLNQTSASPAIQQIVNKIKQICDEKHLLT